MQMKAAASELVRMRMPSFGIPARASTLVAAEKISEVATELRQRPPPDLSEIALRVTAAYSEGAIPERRDLNAAPWCLWGTDSAITKNKVLLERFLADAERRGRRRFFRRLIAAYFESYSEAADGLNAVAATLRTLVPRFDSELSRAAANLNLFDPAEGPHRLANAALARGQPAWDLLRDCGAGALASEAGFARASFLSGLMALRQYSVEHPMDHLQRIRIWGFRNDKSIMYPQHRAALIDALVLPQAERLQRGAERDEYIRFLLENFGDPRLRPGNWSGAESSRLVRRWLTDQSLRQFLDVVDEGALHHQWVYRRSFWEAAHRLDLISDAWVIFDKIGASRARTIFETETPFGSWKSGAIVSAGQACMLLRVGPGLIAEWSHNGRCHIWHNATDPTAPQMHKEVYQPTEVRIPKPARNQRGDYVRTSFVHQGAPSYAWQENVGAEISRMTGIRVTRDEYQVRP
jgi:hypothetical protein